MCTHTHICNVHMYTHVAIHNNFIYSAHCVQMMCFDSLQPVTVFTWFPHLLYVCALRVWAQLESSQCLGIVAASSGFPQCTKTILSLSIVIT